MADIELTPGTLPQPQCYANEQARFEAYVAAIITSLVGGLQWTASDDAPSDLTQYWLRMDGSNPANEANARGLEILKWSVPDAAWVRVFSVPTSTGVTGGAANAFTLTHSPPYLTIGSAYRIGQVYVFEANHAITGSATLNIDGLGAKTIKKRVTVNLIADDILDGQMVSVIFDGTNFQMLSDVSAFDFSNVPPGTLGQVLKTVGPYPGVSVDWADPYFESEEITVPPAEGGAITPVSHDLERKPQSVRWVLRCKETDANFPVGEEVELWSVFSAGGGDSNVAWVVSDDATSLKLRRTVWGQPLTIGDYSSGAVVGFTDTKWKLVAYYA
jgi:hypothetical protein